MLPPHSLLRHLNRLETHQIETHQTPALLPNAPGVPFVFFLCFANGPTGRQLIAMSNLEIA